jgi:hypothetical protein
MSSELDRIRLRLKTFPLVDESSREALEFLVLHLCDERAQEVVPPAEARGWNAGVEAAADVVENGAHGGLASTRTYAAERAFYIRTLKRAT